VRCKTRDEAQRALAFAERFLREELGVTLHPQKTRIVHMSQGFEFLGYKVKQGKGFRLAAQKRRRRANPLNLYAVPREKSVKRFKDQIRQLTRRNAPVKLREVIQQVNPVIRGWIGYFGSYHKSALYPVFRHLNLTLSWWAMRKYKRFRGHRRRAEHWLGRIARRQPTLFAHWQLLGVRPTAG